MQGRAAEVKTPWTLDKSFVLFTLRVQLKVVKKVFSNPQEK